VTKKGPNAILESAKWNHKLKRESRRLKTAGPLQEGGRGMKKQNTYPKSRKRGRQREKGRYAKLPGNGMWKGISCPGGDCKGQVDRQDEMEADAGGTTAPNSR